MALGRKTGGRTAGTPNRATGDVKALAAKHGPDAIAELARLAKGAESEQARVAACRELLDRAYGKARQPLSGAEDAPPLFPTRPDMSGLTDEQLRALAAIPIR
jgi:hypothetical protein